MLFQKFKSGFFNKFENGKNKSLSSDGLVIFQVVEEAIKAEKLLKAKGYDCKTSRPSSLFKEGLRPCSCNQT